MLTTLTVKDFLIIEQIEVHFDPGMTALTGETGTGKSILIDALQLALGKRAQGHLVRHDAGKLSISANFDINTLAAATAWLEQHQLESDENHCILRRTISRDGRSQAFINGTMVTLEQVRELSALLIDVVGQNSQQKLLDSSQHLYMLDLHCNHQAALSQMRDDYQRWRTIDAQLKQKQNDSTENEMERQWLSQQCEELEFHQVREGEFEKIEHEHRVLSQKENIKQSLYTAYNALAADNEQNAISLLHNACKELQIISKLDQNLGGAEELANTALEHAHEVSSELKQYLERIDTAEDSFENLEKRLGVLSELARKYRTQAERLPDLLSQARERLAILDNSENNISQLEEKRAQLAKQYQAIAEQVSLKRRRTAQTLEKEVVNLLAKLNMNQAKFKVAFEQNNSATPSPTGLEHAEFLLCANPGQNLEVLAKAASGGERARISLALQVALSNKRMTPILVFDEVDSGVGGATATTVGQLLKTLSEQAQVFCITHLAQIASQADHHYRVNKSTKNQTTLVSLSKLDKQKRLQELARMLAGSQISQQSLDHAKQMLEAHAG